jgi:hypothetical protein
MVMGELFFFQDYGGIHGYVTLRKVHGMPVDQIVVLCLQISGILFGGGVLGVIVKAWLDNRSQKRTSENEAKRDINSAWDTIVENLQAQITTQTDNFTAQMTFITGKVKTLEEKVEELQIELTHKDRVILKAIAHIGILEALVPPKPVPARPEELQ